MTRAIVFAYHNVGVRCLKVLLAQGIEVALVVTHEDNPNENIWFDSVARTAAEYGIPVAMPANPNRPAFLARLEDLRADFLFSFYYRHMLKPALLGAASRGAYNMHGSLLPKYRGRVPINWAVLHGETETGATLHEMVEKPDAGRIVAQQAVPMLPDDTAGEVFDKVVVAAEMCLLGVLPRLTLGTAPHVPMDLKAGSYFGGRKPEDGRIDWQKPAQDIHNLVRAVAPPYPGAFCDTAAGHLRVLRTIRASDAPAGNGLFAAGDAIFVRCGDGKCLRVLAAELNGRPLAANELENRPIPLG
jgi:methionyl-tRNA formyltransferase